MGESRLAFWDRDSHETTLQVARTFQRLMTNKNWVATLYFWQGRTKTFGTTLADLEDPTAPTAATPGLLGTNDNGYDNVLSFRLRKEGARGD